ncbi:MAG: hypothetical protein ACTSRT_14680 [Promethearchaeota archaeon]
MQNRKSLIFLCYIITFNIGFPLFFNTIPTPPSINNGNKYLPNKSQATIGWNIETIDENAYFESNSYFSTDTDIALDEDGYIHISYCGNPRVEDDGTDCDLKYAKWDGTEWQMDIVPFPVNSCGSSSLAIDSTGSPHISYSCRWEWLVYSKWNVSEWTRTVFGRGNLILGGATSLVLDNNDNPHCIYQYGLWHSPAMYWEYGIGYIKWNGTSWISEVVIGAPYYYKTHHSLALDENGSPHFSYYDYSNGNLRYVSRLEDDWYYQTIDNDGNVGTFTSLAFDKSDNPHISYYDITNGDLKYARWNGTLWLIETIDSEGRVGAYTSLALDENNNPHISYYDVTNGDLKYARWNGTLWLIETIDSEGDVGYLTSIALNTAGRAYISYLDRSNVSLKIAWFGEITDDIPMIVINSPTTNELFGTTAPSFNVEIYDINHDSMWYTLDNGVTNATFTTNGTINQALWSALPDGNIIIRFYANNSGGNIGFAEVTIRKDVTAPIIAINDPQNSDVIGATSPNFDISIDELNLDKTWYSLNGGNNITFTGLTGTINQALWIIRFYANDSAGNIGFAEITIRKDVTAPIITINNPQGSDVVRATAPNFDISIDELNLDKTWYSLNGGNNITFTGLTGTINQALWLRE